MNSGENIKHRLFSSFHLLATRDKPNIDIALESLISLTSETAHKENKALIYGKFIF